MNQNLPARKNNPFAKKLILPAFIMLIFWGVAAWGYLSSGYIEPLILFGYLGAALGGGLGLYALLPNQKKPAGRRLTLLLVGLFLFVLAVFMARENVQIEGAIFGLLTGVVQMAVTHYMIAKIFGPLLFGRLWCGWACWTVMVLDLLPFTRASGRLPGRWGWLRYLHFGLSAALVLVLVFAFDYRDGATGAAAVIWFLAGNLLYYAAGIGLAFALKDNRAFCKYLCPVSVPLKIASRPALLKISGDPNKCSGCRACVNACPMDIRVADYISSHQRVLSTECSLCQTCITSCSQDALKVSFGFDLGGKELLVERAPRHGQG